jgi:hypothetical protein
VLVSLLLVAPALLFWLWLVILPARMAILCPEECVFDSRVSLVSCFNTTLTAVSSIRFTLLNELVLRESNITFLVKDCFLSLTELEILEINRCGLRTIDLGAFNGLTNLAVLILGNNKINNLLPFTFEKLKILQHISLKINNLEYLDSEVFSGALNLQYIDLLGNELLYLHPDTFLGLPKLRFLFLDSNPTLQIPTDRNFINSHSLSDLAITDCNVRSLSVETFANVSGLKWLNLQYNNLRTVDINILRALPKLSTLYLMDNPLQCDCQLQEVWRWCEDRNIRTVYRGIAPECDTPSEVKGMWWGVLEKGQCLDGNIQYYGDYNSTRYIYDDIELDKNLYDYDFDIKLADQVLKQYQLPVYAIPFLFGTISNAILLIIIICNMDMRTVPNMYILNLVISDIICLTALFTESCTKTISDTQETGHFKCTFLPFCRRMSVGLSAYSVAVYSFQRYRVIANPIQFRVSSQAKWRVTVATICGVWILAALSAVPSALSQYLCVGIFFGNRTKHGTYYVLVVIFELLVSCVLPLCVVAFSYIMAARLLVESSRPISEGTQTPQLETRRKTAKVVVGLAVVFLISYVPYHVFWTYFTYREKYSFIKNYDDEFEKSNQKSQYTYLISNSFFLINSCLNPVAVICTSSPFRQHLKRYLTCFCKTNPPPTDFELRIRN